MKSNDLLSNPDITMDDILELKYLPSKEYETKAPAQWQEAVDQIHRYAEAPRVQQLIQGTRLHCIVMQFSGWELARMEEV